jgi:hypothetical protein
MISLSRAFLSRGKKRVKKRKPGEHIDAELALDRFSITCYQRTGGKVILSTKVFAISVPHSTGECLRGCLRIQLPCGFWFPISPLPPFTKGGTRSPPFIKGDLGGFLDSL